MINDRRKAEKIRNMCSELQDFLSNKTKELLNFIFDGVYIVDLSRCIQFWNTGAEKITGYSAEEVVGHCCKDDILNHIDENGKLLCTDRCPLTSVFKTGEPIEQKIYPLHKSGYRFPTSTHIGAIKSNSGKIIGAIEVFRDISSEEKLLIMERKFAKLIKQYVSNATYDLVWKSAEEESDLLKATTKDLTVLFIDIVGFTSLSEKHTPDEIIEVLNSFFSITSHIIRIHTGDIDKFIGDCVMATFIDARDAVDTAKEILHDALPGLNASLRARGLPEINVRVGINSGNLVQGDIGSEDRKDMTVIGDVVNTASRVEGAAAPGTFLISESTLSRLDPGQAFAFFKEIRLKGKMVPVKLYRPV